MGTRRRRPARLRPPQLVLTRMPRAPRRCPGGAGTCTELIINRPYCPEHTQAWAGPRTASSRITSTRQWRELEPEILRRDGYACQIRYAGICTGYATVVDKITPAAHRSDLAFVASNLRAACEACNDAKARTADRGRAEPPRLPA